VTFDTADAVSKLAAEEVTWAHHPTTRDIPNLARNAWLARRVLAKQKPDVIVSTGAAVAYPFFVLARAQGIPTVYVEVYDRIDSRTVTGRLCRPLSTLFCVQWEEQLDLYPGAVFVGPLL
jgi:UDP-N-acetylglucosamine:LPS N-acetylglucosamine transferase